MKKLQTENKRRLEGEGVSVFLRPLPQIRPVYRRVHDDKPDINTPRGFSSIFFCVGVWSASSNPYLFLDVNVAFFKTFSKSTINISLF